MKHRMAYHIAWIIAGCFFAEAAFLLAQISLILLLSQQSHSLPELLAANNPFYAVPSHFPVMGAVFLIAVLYGALRHIRRITYYIGCGLVAAIAFHIARYLSDDTASVTAIMIDLVAAAISGLVYGAIQLRQKF